MNLPETPSPTPDPTRRGVLAGGNWIVDHLKVIDVWPAQDSLARIHAQASSNGGAPYNLLKNLARIGARYPLTGIGLIGDDADGELIRDDCRAHGVDISRLHTTTAAATSYTDVMTVRANGRRTFFHQVGANARLGPEHFDFSGARERIFLLGYLLLLDTLDAPGADGRPAAADVLRRAREAGLLTCVDCVSENSDRFQTMVAAMLPEVDVLFANDFEAEKLTGLNLGRGAGLDRAAVEAAARRLLAAGVRSWVVLHFPEGACACSAAGEVCWQGSVRLPAELIKGSAGAGDAFACGVIHGLHEGWPMRRGLELGVACAAASLREVSCSDGVESMEACLALAAAHGHRGKGEV